MRHPLLILAVVLAAAVMLLRWRSDAVAPGDVPQASVNEVEPRAGGDDSRSAEEGRISAASEVDGLSELVERAAAEDSSTTAALHGRVTDPDGRPIAGATLSWAGELPHRFWRHWSTRLSKASWELTDTRGRFSFESVPDLQGLPWSSVFEAKVADATWLWVSHPDFGAKCVELGAVMTDPVVVVLERANPVRVRVVDASGPVDGAEVWLVAIPAPEMLEDPRSVLVRTSLTGSDGQTELPAMGGGVGLVATHGDRRSKPYEGELREGLELALHETFVVHGSVHTRSAPEDPAFRLVEEVDVDVAVLRGRQMERVATLPVGQDGVIEPTAIPLLDADAYRFSLVAPSYAQVAQELRPVPATGERVAIDLDAETGHGLWAYVMDENGEPLVDARVVARWGKPQDLGGSVETRPFPMTADFPGYAYLSGLPAGEVWLEAHAPGRASVIIEPLRLPEVAPGSWELQLFPGGSLSGRVTHAGRPVTQFEICYWRTQRIDEIHRVAFHDRVDGTFLIPGMPTGEVAVLASAPTLPHGPAQTLLVRGGEVTNADFQLPRSVRGRGRVVDAISGEPIAGAVIQRTATASGMLTVAERGSPVRADEAGRFELDGLVDGENAIEVFAPDRGMLKVWRRPVEGVVDFGTVRLTPVQTLRVQVHGIAEGAEASYSVDCIGFQKVYSVPVAANGVAIIEGLAATSSYDVQLDRGGAVVRQASVSAAPGTDWAVTFDLGGAALQIVPEAADGEALPSDLVAFVSTRGARGEPLSMGQNFDGAESVEFQVPQGQTFVELRTPSRTLAQTSVEVVGDTLVRVPLGDAAYPFVLVDSDGVPLAGVALYLRHELRDTPYMTARRTDDEGRFEVHGALPGRHFFMAHHPSRGRMPFSLVLPETPPSDSVELVFDPSSSLSVLALDAGEPVGGADCRLSAYADYMELPSETTGAAGLASWTSVGAASYQLTVQRPGYWPSRTSVEVSGAGSSHTVHLDRRVAADWLLRDDEGKPLGVAEVRIEHAEHGSWSQWTARGLVAGAEALRTDSAGRLELAGIPEGLYALRVTAADGRELEAAITLGREGGRTVVELTAR